MRTINYTKKFKKDYKREKNSGRYPFLNKELLMIVELLALDKILPKRYHDHGLSGNWNDHRDCHIKPDLVLIYRKPNQKSLDLVRLGSHSELSL